MNFDSELRERLIQRRGQWPKIAAGAEVSHSWLSQFARNKIPNPGFVTLKRLAEAMDALPGEGTQAHAAGVAARDVQ